MGEAIKFIANALAERDARNAKLPCAPGKRLPKECPYCGATARDGCGPTARNDHRFAEITRAILAKAKETA